jgi:putative aminopeptidase FrvX
MIHAADLALLRRVTSIPTAPFVEHRVDRFVDQFAKQHKLKLVRDPFGNALLTRPGKSKAGPRLVLVAHTDHPGFVAHEMTGPNELIAYFRGGVYDDYVKNSKVVFFDGQRQIKGKVSAILDSEANRPLVVQVKVDRAVSPNSAGMFDLGEAKVSGKLLKSRVCDDLAGVASALAAISRKPKTPAAGDLCVLLTRGEEVGFIGALAVVKHKTLLRKSDLVVSIECSAQQPVAVQGKGVVLRVGDRTSIFNSAFSHFIHTLAQEIQKTDKRFVFQRALMPGGTCEATAFDAFGHVAAAVCVPLGNYHNMNTVTKKLAPETVHLTDWACMVELFVALAAKIHEYKPGHIQLKKRLDGLLKKHLHLLGNQRDA